LYKLSKLKLLASGVPKTRRRKKLFSTAGIWLSGRSDRCDDTARLPSAQAYPAQTPEADSSPVFRHDPASGAPEARPAQHSRAGRRGVGRRVYSARLWRGESVRYWITLILLGLWLLAFPATAGDDPAYGLFSRPYCHCDACCRVRDETLTSYQVRLAGRSGGFVFRFVVFIVESMRSGSFLDSEEVDFVSFSSYPVGEEVQTHDK